MQNTTKASPSWGGTHPGIPLSLDFHSGEAPLATSPPTRRPSPRSTIFRTPLSYLLSGIFLSLLPIGLREQPGFAEAQTGGVPALEDRVTVLENTVSSQQVQINTLTAALAAETTGTEAVEATFQSNINTIFLTPEGAFLGRDI